MCRSADRDVLFSSEFRNALLPTEQVRLVSVGRYALRGVSRAQELFTLDPETVGKQIG
jgi:adenylate cyclase